MTGKRRELERLIEHPEQIPGALMWVEAMSKRGLPSGPVAVRLGRERRTLDQNAKLWPMCQDVAAQVEWYGKHLGKDEWKDVFTASLKRQKVVPGLDGEFVIVGGGSSRLTKRQFCELVELIYCFGAEHDVVWSEKARQAFAEYREDEAA